MIRFSIDGIEYSVDTVQEAADLRRLLTRQKAASKAASSRWRGKPTPESKSKAPEINRVFSALYSADRHRLSSEQLAKDLGVKTGAIPPLFAHAKAWASKVAPTLDFQELITRGESMGGVTVFILTDKAVALVRNAKEARGELAF